MFMDIMSNLSSFLVHMPKVELHAHLNGSIGPNLARRLVQLLKEVDPQRPPPELPPDWSGSLAQSSKDFDFSAAFAIFPLVQRLTEHPRTLREAVRGVVEEFRLDGVRYLELRSTPRATFHMTEEDYVRTLVEEIQMINTEESSKDVSSIARDPFSGCKRILVRLLLSIDRRQGLEKAENTLKLAKKYKALYPDVVVGLDLSGDPTKGDARHFIDVLRRGRDEHGLGISVHLAEIPNSKETLELLNLLTSDDRLGHGTCIHSSTGGSEELWEKLVEKTKSPVEVCITSNLKCGSVPQGDVAQHHVAKLIEVGHPFVVCTDDRAIFNCELSGEYLILAEHIRTMNEKELFHVSKKAIDYAFVSEEVKKKLKEQWDSFQSQEKL